jgi:Mg-chelatase subunit ChlD
VVIPSLETVQDDEDVERLIPELQKVDEKPGKLKSQTDEEKLMHSVLEDDKEKISDGRLISEAITHGIGSLTPDIVFQNLVKDFKLAKKLYGDTIIRELTGYSPNYIEKNINIPEFKRELNKKISEKIEELGNDGLINKEGAITDKGLTLSALVLYVEELDNLMPKGFGEKLSKKKSIYGDKQDYKKMDSKRYRDIAIKQTIKTSLRRGHLSIEPLDIKTYERQNEGRISIIYGLDASGSMKGDKLRIAKKAGIALAFKAIQEHDKVGLVVFGSDIKQHIAPTNDFMHILKTLADIRASMETDISKSILKAIELFPKHDTKHLILLTDALPTKGLIPENETLKAVSQAKDQKITISLVGINLDHKGLELAKKIVQVGQGKLYTVKDLEQIDKIILEDYEQLKKE